MNLCCLWLQSFPPFSRSDICPICFEYKWLLNKSHKEFNLTGCLTCSLKIKNDYNQLKADEIDDFIENFTNKHNVNYKYKATGRYN
jgi:hypothetical protein|uniref:Uncharacterized protein n=1 Tax=viral metagenome TaxID=1070528 RepID=A0A6C0IQZ9_9ZZZZ